MLRANHKPVLAGGRRRDLAAAGRFRRLASSLGSRRQDHCRRRDGAVAADLRAHHKLDSRPVVRVISWRPVVQPSGRCTRVPCGSPPRRRRDGLCSCRSSGRAWFLRQTQGRAGERRSKLIRAPIPTSAALHSALEMVRVLAGEPVAWIPNALIPCEGSVQPRRSRRIAAARKQAALRIKCSHAYQSAVLA
jgi:hypothetical protein